MTSATESGFEGFRIARALDHESHFVAPDREPARERQTDRPDDFAISRIGNRLGIRDHAHDREPRARILEPARFDPFA